MYLFALVSKLIIIDGPEKIKLMAKEIEGWLFSIFNSPKKDGSSLIVLLTSCSRISASWNEKFEVQRGGTNG